MEKILSVKQNIKTPEEYNQIQNLINSKRSVKPQRQI